MANHLDLDEQEQLDQLKHFWRTYGNLITWALIAVLGAFAAWNGYQYWQRSQAAQAAAMFDEVERSVASNDVAKVERALADMNAKFGSSVYAQQAGLLAAKTFYDKGNEKQHEPQIKQRCLMQASASLSKLICKCGCDAVSSLENTQ